MVFLHAKIPGSGVVNGVLHAVVSDDIDGVPVHLLENAAAAPRSHHQKPVAPGQLVENGAVERLQMRLVLCQCAVKIKRHDSDVFLLHICVPLSWFTWFS